MRLVQLSCILMIPEVCIGLYQISLRRNSDQKIRKSALNEELASLLEMNGFTIGISVPELLEYERRGHLCTRDVFEASEIEKWYSSLLEIANDEMEVALNHARTMNVGDETPFLQNFNPHRRYSIVYELATCPKLTMLAAELLGTTQVRLYQTSIFRKRPNDLATRWHSDLRAAPIDTNDFVTAWIPLHDIPPAEYGGTGLLYADASHRDMSHALWYGPDHDASNRYECTDHGFISAGDISWHHGWCLHSAAANTLSEERIAIAISFFADGARLLDINELADLNDEDHPSFSDWIYDLRAGDYLEHPLLPLVAAV